MLEEKPNYDNIFEELRTLREENRALKENITIFHDDNAKKYIADLEYDKELFLEFLDSCSNYVNDMQYRILLINDIIKECNDKIK